MSEARITAESLELYSHVASCISSPLCLVDRKGFVHFVNDSFRDMLSIPVSADFPFIGRFLDSASSTQVRHILNELGESPVRKSIIFSARFSPKYVADKHALDLIWSIAGHAFTPVYVISGGYASLGMVLPSFSYLIDSMIKTSVLKTR